MYLNCCNERSAEKQHRLEQCLLELLQTDLYDNISVSGLCEKAGISRKTFYRLFDSKADVIYALVDHTLMEFASYEPDPAVSPGEFHKFLAFFKQQKPLLDALQNNRISALLTERSLRLILTEDPEGLARFGANDTAFSKEMMLFYISGIFALVLDWHASGYERTIDEMAELFKTIMCKTPVCPHKNK